MRPADLVARITRRSRSNFFYGFLALPRPRRDALYAVYAFCRTVDDIADLGQERGDDPVVLREALGRWRHEVSRCFTATESSTIPSPGGCRPRCAPIRFPARLWKRSSMGWKATSSDPHTETAEDLYPYCYRVASAVGLCAIEIFGYTDPRARQYAIDLGMALQLTNIMRDVGTDVRAGRVYLPQADLRAFGVSVEDLHQARYDDAVVRLMEHQAERARSFFRAAWQSYPSRDARSLVPAEIMGRIYFALLEEIEARRFRVFHERITLSTSRKVAVAVGCWLRARMPRAA